jgi:hypothetical protein
MVHGAYNIKLIYFLFLIICNFLLNLIKLKVRYFYKFFYSFIIIIIITTVVTQMEYMDFNGQKLFLEDR